MTPAEKLIVHTVESELADDSEAIILDTAISRTARKLGLAHERVAEVFRVHGFGGVSYD
jgi:hypothetical protein